AIPSTHCVVRDIRGYPEQPGAQQAVPLCGVEIPVKSYEDFLGDVFRERAIANQAASVAKYEAVVHDKCLIKAEAFGRDRFVGCARLTLPQDQLRSAHQLSLLRTRSFYVV